MSRTWQTWFLSLLFFLAFIFVNKGVSVLGDIAPNIVLSDELKIGLIGRLSISSGKDFAFDTKEIPQKSRVFFFLAYTHQDGRKYRYIPGLEDSLFDSNFSLGESYYIETNAVFLDGQSVLDESVHLLLPALPRSITGPPIFDINNQSRLGSISVQICSFYSDVDEDITNTQPSASFCSVTFNYGPTAKSCAIRYNGTPYRINFGEHFRTGICHSVLSQYPQPYCLLPHDDSEGDSQLSAPILVSNRCPEFCFGGPSLGDDTSIQVKQSLDGVAYTNQALNDNSLYSYAVSHPELDVQVSSGSTKRSRTPIEHFNAHSSQKYFPVNSVAVFFDPKTQNGNSVESAYSAVLRNIFFGTVSCVPSLVEGSGPQWAGQISIVSTDVIEPKSVCVIDGAREAREYGRRIVPGYNTATLLSHFSPFYSDKFGVTDRTIVRLGKTSFTCLDGFVPVRDTNPLETTALCGRKGDEGYPHLISPDFRCVPSLKMCSSDELANLFIALGQASRTEILDKFDLNQWYYEGDFLRPKNISARKHVEYNSLFYQAFHLAPPMCRVDASGTPYWDFAFQLTWSEVQNKIGNTKIHSCLEQPFEPQFYKSPRGRNILFGRCLTSITYSDLLETPVSDDSTCGSLVFEFPYAQHLYSFASSVSGSSPMVAVTFPLDFTCQTGYTLNPLLRFASSARESLVLICPRNSFFWIASRNTGEFLSFVPGSLQICIPELKKLDTNPLDSSCLSQLECSSYRAYSKLKIETTTTLTDSDYVSLVNTLEFTPAVYNAVSPTVNDSAPSLYQALRQFNLDGSAANWTLLRSSLSLCPRTFTVQPIARFNSKMNLVHVEQLVQDKPTDVAKAILDRMRGATYQLSAGSFSGLLYSGNFGEFFVTPSGTLENTMRIALQDMTLYHGARYAPAFHCSTELLLPYSVPLDERSRYTDVFYSYGEVTHAREAPKRGLPLGGTMLIVPNKRATEILLNDSLRYIVAVRSVAGKYLPVPQGESNAIAFRCTSLGLLPNQDGIPFFTLRQHSIKGVDEPLSYGQCELPPITVHTRNSQSYHDKYLTVGHQIVSSFHSSEVRNVDGFSGSFYSKILPISPFGFHHSKPDATTPHQVPHGYVVAPDALKCVHSLAPLFGGILTSKSVFTLPGSLPGEGNLFPSLANHRIGQLRLGATCREGLWRYYLPDLERRNIAPMALRAVIDPETPLNVGLAKEVIFSTEQAAHLFPGLINAGLSMEVKDEHSFSQLPPILLRSSLFADLFRCAPPQSVSVLADATVPFVNFNHSNESGTNFFSPTYWSYEDRRPTFFIQANEVLSLTQRQTIVTMDQFVGNTLYKLSEIPRCDASNCILNGSDDTPNTPFWISSEFLPTAPQMPVGDYTYPFDRFLGLGDALKAPLDKIGEYDAPHRVCRPWNSDNEMVPSLVAGYPTASALTYIVAEAWNGEMDYGTLSGVVNWEHCPTHLGWVPLSSPQERLVCLSAFSEFASFSSQNLATKALSNPFSIDIFCKDLTRRVVGDLQSDDAYNLLPRDSIDRFNGEWRKFQSRDINLPGTLYYGNDVSVISPQGTLDNAFGHNFRIFLYSFSTTKAKNEIFDPNKTDSASVVTRISLPLNAAKYEKIGARYSLVIRLIREIRFHPIRLRFESTYFIPSTGTTIWLNTSDETVNTPFTVVSALQKTCTVHLPFDFTFETPNRGDNNGLDASWYGVPLAFPINTIFPSWSVCNHNIGLTTTYTRTSLLNSIVETEWLPLPSMTLKCEESSLLTIPCMPAMQFSKADDGKQPNIDHIYPIGVSSTACDRFVGSLLPVQRTARQLMLHLRINPNALYTNAEFFFPPFKADLQARVTISALGSTANDLIFDSAKWPFRLAPSPMEFKAQIAGFGLADSPQLSFRLPSAYITSDLFTWNGDRTHDSYLACGTDLHGNIIGDSFADQFFQDRSTAHNLDLLYHCAVSSGKISPDTVSSSLVLDTRAVFSLSTNTLRAFGADQQNIPFSLPFGEFFPSLRGNSLELMALYGQDFAETKSAFAVGLGTFRGVNPQQLAEVKTLLQNLGHTDDVISAVTGPTDRFTLMTNAMSLEHHPEQVMSRVGFLSALQPPLPERVVSIFEPGHDPLQPMVDWVKISSATTLRGAFLYPRCGLHPSARVDSLPLTSLGEGRSWLGFSQNFEPTSSLQLLQESCFLKPASVLSAPLPPTNKPLQLSGLVVEYNFPASDANCLVGFQSRKFTSAVIQLQATPKSEPVTSIGSGGSSSSVFFVHRRLKVAEFPGMTGTLVISTRSRIEIEQNNLPISMYNDLFPPPGAPIQICMNCNDSEYVLELFADFSYYSQDYFDPVSSTSSKYLRYQEQTAWSLVVACQGNTGELKREGMKFKVERMVLEMLAGPCGGNAEITITLLSSTSQLYPFTATSVVFPVSLFTITQKPIVESLALHARPSTKMPTAPSLFSLSKSFETLSSDGLTILSNTKERIRSSFSITEDDLILSFGDGVHCGVAVEFGDASLILSAIVPKTLFVYSIQLELQSISNVETLEDYFTLPSSPLSSQICTDIKEDTSGLSPAMRRIQCIVKLSAHPPPEDADPLWTPLSSRRSFPLESLVIITTVFTTKPAELVGTIAMITPFAMVIPPWPQTPPTLSNLSVSLIEETEEEQDVQNELPLPYSHIMVTFEIPDVSFANPPSPFVSKFVKERTSTITNDPLKTWYYADFPEVRADSSSVTRVYGLLDDLPGSKPAMAPTVTTAFLETPTLGVFLQTVRSGTPLEIALHACFGGTITAQMISSAGLISFISTTFSPDTLKEMLISQRRTEAGGNEENQNAAEQAVISALHSLCAGTSVDEMPLDENTPESSLTSPGRALMAHNAANSALLSAKAMFDTNGALLESHVWVGMPTILAAARTIEIFLAPHHIQEGNRLPYSKLSAAARLHARAALNTFTQILGHLESALLTRALARAELSPMDLLSMGSAAGSASTTIRIGSPSSALLRGWSLRHAVLLRSQVRVQEMNSFAKSIQDIARSTGVSDVVPTVVTQNAFTSLDEALLNLELAALDRGDDVDNDDNDALRDESLSIFASSTSILTSLSIIAFPYSSADSDTSNISNYSQSGGALSLSMVKVPRGTHFSGPIYQDSLPIQNGSLTLSSLRSETSSSSVQVQLPHTLLNTLSNSTDTVIALLVVNRGVATELAQNSTKQPSSDIISSSQGGIVALSLHDSRDGSSLGPKAQDSLRIAASDDKTGLAPIDQEWFFIEIPIASAESNPNDQAPVRGHNLASRCVYTEDMNSFISDTSRSWDADASCVLHEVLRTSVICRCTHLTFFSVRLSTQALVPRFQEITIDQLRLISWDNLTRNITPFVIMVSWPLVALLFFVIAHYSDRRLYAQGFAKLLLDWDAAKQPPPSKQLQFRVSPHNSMWYIIWRRYLYTIRDTHMWLSVFMRQTTHNYSSKSRAFAAMVLMLSSFTLSGLFFGYTNQGFIAVIIMTSACLFLISEFMRFIFDRSEEDKIKRFLYYYAESLVYFYYTGKSALFPVAEHEELMKKRPEELTAHGSAILGDIVLSLGWEAVPMGAVHAHTNPEVVTQEKNTLFDKSIVKTYASGDVDTFFFRSRTREYRLQKHEALEIHRLVRTKLPSSALNAKHVSQTFENRSIFETSLSFNFCFGLALIFIWILACYFLIVVNAVLLATKSDNTVTSSSTRDWVTSAGTSILLDMFVTSFALGIVKSTLFYFIRLFGNACCNASCCGAKKSQTNSVKAENSYIAALPDLKSFRRLSFYEIDEDVEMVTLDKNIYPQNSTANCQTTSNDVKRIWEIADKPEPESDPDETGDQSVFSGQLRLKPVIKPSMATDSVPSEHISTI